MAPPTTASLQERIEALEVMLRPSAVGVLAPTPIPLTPDQERRRVVASILNTNLLAPDARKQFEQEYAELGAKLEKAAAKAADK